MKLDKKNVQVIWLGMLLLFPIVLWVLPATFFDDGQALCPSRVFLGIECFGCGMTRAVMHLHHLDIDEAVYYNTGVLVAYPALVIIWAYWVRNTWKRIKGLPVGKTK